VGKNICKVSVLAWIALLLFVLFGCKESKISQSSLPIPKECESLFPKQEINFDFHKEWVNPDRQSPVHSIEDYKENPAIRQKDVKDIPWVKARMDSICGGGVNVKHKDSKDSIICSVFEH
jgi:hypothetical protein